MYLKNRELWLDWSNGYTSKEINKMIKKQPWYHHFLNRRVWGAFAGAGCLIFGSMGWTGLSSTLGTIAGALGGWSYLKPQSK